MSFTIQMFSLILNVYVWAVLYCDHATPVEYLLNVPASIIVIPTKYLSYTCKLVPYLSQDLLC